MTIPRPLLEEHKGLGDWNILLGYVGSISHGTYLAPKEKDGVDDKDVMGICIPPPNHYMGFANYGSRGTREIKEMPWDIVIYEVKKALNLLAGGNPNMLAILWLPERGYINIKPSGQLLLNSRELFVGRHVYRAFVGYARSQLHKMTHGAHEGYMGEKRKALVQQFGYDTKNASHLIRLLRMAVEFLKDGVLNVERTTDASELIEIKKGQWSLKQVKDEADYLFKLADQAYLQSDLPVGPNMFLVEDTCREMIRMEWARRGELV